MSHESVQQRLLKTPQGLLTILAFCAGLTGWIIQLTEAKQVYWPTLVYPLGAALALAGYGLRVVHFYIIAAGLLFTDASSRLTGVQGGAKDKAAFAMFVICLALSFVGYPFKLRKNFKFDDPFNIAALLGAILTLVSTILYYINHGPANPQIFLIAFFVWGAYGGSGFATALALYFSGAIITDNFGTLVGFKILDSEVKAAGLLGLFGAALLGGVILAIVAKDGKNEEEEQPLLK